MLRQALVQLLKNLLLILHGAALLEDLDDDKVSRSGQPEIGVFADELVVLVLGDDLPLVLDT